MQAERSAFFCIRTEKNLISRYKAAKVLDCLPFAARLPSRAWLARKKSSSLRYGIFSCQALRKKALQEAGGL